MQKTFEHTFDAAGKTLGRVASEAAKALMGKMEATYVPNNPPAVKVTVTNVHKLHIADKKKRQTEYTRYSGYPGGFKKESLAHLIGRSGNTEALRRAIERMLPRNTLRVGRMKRLTITK